MNPRTITYLLAAAAATLAAAIGSGVAAAAPVGAQATLGAQSSTAAARPRPVARLRLEGGPWGYPSPFLYARGPGLVHVNFVFDTLLWKDGTGRTIPWLAQRFTRSADGLEYRAVLRPNIRWHDGRALTAQDVVFTFDYLRTGPGRNALGITPPLDFIRDVTAPNARTVVFRLSSRFAPFPVTVAGRVPIIPRHVWTDVSDPLRFRDPRAVIGSGPYRIAAYEEATGSYRYTANTRYFLGTPVVRQLDFVPSADPMLSLRRGQLDAGGPTVEDGVPSGVLRPFQQSARYGVLQAPGEWNRALHFNMTRGFPYSNRTFRQAVAHSINRSELVRRILFGRGAPGSMGMLAPTNPFSAKDLPSYPFNQARARQLLTSIGLVDRDGDGWRDLPNGQPLRIDLVTSTFQSAQAAELVREWLRQVGLDVRLRSLDRAAADAATAAGNYEMALIGYGGLGGEPDGLRTRLSSAVRARSFNRVHGYDNRRFEDLAAAQLVTVNGAVRRRMLHEMQRLIAQDVPAISLYVPTRIHIYDKRLFSAWYFTPGGVFGGYPGPLNKHAFVTGKKAGL